jgi:hypothetical protein
MKKIFVVLALAGMVGSVSAGTIAAANGVAIVAFKGDDKGKKKKSKKKECCSGTTNAAGSKSCSKDGEKAGGCCKDKKAAETDTKKPQ